MRAWAVGGLLVVLLFGFPSVSHCQSAASGTATFSGTLSDASGAVISGGQVSISTLDAGSPGRELLRVLSGNDGRYTATVPAGHCCVLRVTHPSFVTREETVRVAPGESRTVDFLLQINPLASTIVVTAQAEPASADSTPAPVTVLTREDFERRQANSLPDLLATQPGISLSRTGRGGGPTSLFLNGGNSNFTKVLVDGTPVNEPGNAVDFSNFTLENIDKVEVVRGAESALFGSDAVAGVIQVFTHRGSTRTPEVSLFAEGGSFSTARGGAQLSGLAGRFDYSAAAAYFQTGGQGPNDGFLNRTLSGNFGWRFSQTNQFRLALRNNISDAGITGQTLLLPPNLDQHNALHNFSANGSWQFSTGSHWTHRLSGAESYNHEFFSNPLADFFDPGDPFCAPLSPKAVPSFTCDFPFTVRNQFSRAGFSEQSAYLLRKGTVTAGYQYEVENAFLSALNGAHARRNNQGGFLDALWQPLARLTLSAGARAEANKSFGTRVVPRAGLAYALRLANGLWGDTRVRLSYGQGIKEPRLGESFGTDPCFPGNPNLRPERSHTWTAGIEQKLAADRVKVSAGYFQNRFYDLISFTDCFPGGPCPVTPPGNCGFGFGTFFNTDLARARGTNVVVEARPAHWLLVSGNYTYDDTRVLKAPNAFDLAEISGNRLLRRPVSSGNVDLNAAFRRMNWNLAGYFSGRRTDSDFLGLGLTRNPGYARFDLATSYALSHGVSLTGRVANLFDKQYQEAIGFPALGREVRVGVKYTFHRE